MSFGSNRKNKRIFLLAVNLVLIGFVLCLVEIYLRWADPLKSLPPNQMFGDPPLTWGHPIDLNNWGFRERDIGVPKPKNTFRVMVLGDSITWGEGIREEERFTNLVEKELKKTEPNRNIEILNFGVPGIPTLGQKVKLLRYKDEVNPDRIVIGFCVNDPQPRAQNYSHERETYRRNIAPVIISFGKLLAFGGLSKIGETLPKSTERALEILGLIPHWVEALDRVYDKESEEWTYFVKDLNEIKKISDEMNLPPPIFMLLSQGIYTKKPTNYKDPDTKTKTLLKWFKQVEALALRLGYDVVKTQDAFEEEFSDKISGINPIDAHPSAGLHTLYANRLSIFLRESQGIK